MDNYIETELKDIKQTFNIDDIIKFQSKHTLEIIRGEDWLYYCYIDKKAYTSGFTPMGALIYGILQFKEHNNE